MRNNSKISVSGRSKPNFVHIEEFLNLNYPEVDIRDIDYIFGFREENPINGGRPYRGLEITDEDLHWMYDTGIGFKLPLSNLFTTEDDYDQYSWILEKYHRPGNVVIAVHNWMATRIKTIFRIIR